MRKAAHLSPQLLRPDHQRGEAAAVDHVEYGDQRKDDAADEGEHRVGGHQQAQRDDEHDDHTRRHRKRRHRLPGLLDVGIGDRQQPPGRVRLMPPQRQRQVAGSHPAPVAGSELVLHAAGVDTPARDPQGLEHRDRHDQQSGAGERSPHHMARLEGRQHGVFGDPPEHIRLADRHQRPKRAAQHRDGER